MMFFEFIHILFKDYAPTIVSVVAIFLTFRHEERQINEQRNKELQIRYFEKNLDFLETISKDAFYLTELLDKCITRSSQEERCNLRKEFILKYNEFIDKFLSYYTQISAINNMLDLNADYNGLKMQIDIFCKRLRDVCDEYILKPITDDSLEMINNATFELRKEIEKRNNDIVMKMKEKLKVSH